MLRALTLAGCAFAGVRGEDHWAVLVAGSNTYGNYRHQADVCHAYQVLIARGFHADKIITMMYDDVANSPQNPFKGQLFNYPWKTMEEAVDVYKGCQIDYRSTDVTPQKFQAVLTGDAGAAGGKVLQSGPDDHVFINFVDHGAVGLIAFPRGIYHAKDLISTLTTMHEKKMYKQLSFYLETCESGSMFQGLLPKKLPVYAVTAANAKESSWGTWCGGDATVGGKPIYSCLGDLFSVNWLMDSDKTVSSNESLAAQFSRVKKTTDKSHVMRYGQVHHIGHEQVSDFQGPGASARASTLADFSTLASASAISARDATLDSLYHIYRAEGTKEAGDNLVKEIQARQTAKRLGESLAASLSGKQVDGDEIEWTEALLDCHRDAVMAFESNCGWNEQRLPLSRTLYKLCVSSSSNGRPVRAAIEKACTPASAAELPQVVV